MVTKKAFYATVSVIFDKVLKCNDKRISSYLTWLSSLLFFLNLKKKIRGESNPDPCRDCRMC